MQNLVGIVRREEELKKALTELEQLDAARRQAGVTGNREYNPGWHTALDLSNLLTISKAITLGRDRTQGKPGRTLPRRLSEPR